MQSINGYCPIVQTSFNLNQDDSFVLSQGISYAHYACMPSPIGLNDRGDYRREGGVDTITSNGSIYIFKGHFTAAEVSNTRDKRRTDGGTDDPSVSNLILPRFYDMGRDTPGQINTNPQDNQCRILLAPGDRVYVSDPNCDVRVINYQKMVYESGINTPMFPIICMDLPIYDSNNVQYVEGLDYVITPQGNISWLATGKNTGHNPSTGLGRVYSIRYTYKAFFYVVALPKEVRMAVVTEGGVRQAERMAYNATIQREYLYHNQNKGDPKNTTLSKTPDRAVQEPLGTVTPNPSSIIVDMTLFKEDGSES